MSGNFLANRAKFDLELIGHREFNKGFESFMNLVFFLNYGNS